MAGSSPWELSQLSLIWSSSSSSLSTFISLQAVHFDSSSGNGGGVAPPLSLQRPVVDHLGSNTFAQVGLLSLAQTFCTFGGVSLTQYSWLKILLQTRFSWTGPPWSTPPTRTSRTTRAPPRSWRPPWETTTFVSTILRTSVELNETFKLLRILIRTLCTGAFNKTTRKVELSLPRSALPSLHSFVPDDLTYKMRPDTAHVVGRDYARYSKYFVLFSIYPLTDLSQRGPGLTSSDPVLPLNQCTDRCIPGLLPCHPSRLSQDLTSPGL